MPLAQGVQQSSTQKLPGLRHFLGNLFAGTGKAGGDRHPKIQNNVLIGASATVLGNIVVGKGAQVAAGSMVLKDVPPRTMVAGSPAKIVGCVSGALLFGCQLSNLIITCPSDFPTFPYTVSSLA